MIPSRPKNQYRRWVFTVNNYTTAEYNAIKDTQCKWLIVGKEVGDAGVPHLQGAVIFNAAKRLTAVKKLPGFTRAHLEQMKGTPQHSFEYCTKQDTTAFEKGEMPKPGKRNDLKNATNAIRTGKSLAEMASEEQYGPVLVKYHKGLQFFKTLLTPTRNPEAPPPTVLWLWGPTGAGKTKAAVQLGNLAGDFWISHGNLQWFDGYTCQKVAIFDDLRHKHCTFDYLLRLLDRYPMKVPIKGSFVEWVPQLIIITAPMSPKDMWNLRRQGDVDQLLRRITKIIQLPQQKNSIFLRMLPESFAIAPVGVNTKEDCSCSDATEESPQSYSNSDLCSSSSEEVRLVRNPTSVKLPVVDTQELDILSMEMMQKNIDLTCNERLLEKEQEEREETFGMLSLIDTDELEAEGIFDQPFSPISSYEDDRFY